jgi:septum formation protein
MMSPDIAPPLILASMSPRRRELLGRVGVRFAVRPAEVDEDALTAAFVRPPEELAGYLAEQKAAACADGLAADEAGTVILAADTTVLLDGTLLGKPRDAPEAWEMLRRLRGRTHRVRTGVVVRTAGAIWRAAVTTPVTMRDYTDDEIARYIASGDPFDKAGAYAIQHPDFQPVARIDGCATNVIGLPLCETVALLRAAGISGVTPPPPPNGCPWDARCRLASPRQ